MRRGRLAEIAICSQCHTTRTCLSHGLRIWFFFIVLRFCNTLLQYTSDVRECELFRSVRNNFVEMSMSDFRILFVVTAYFVYEYTKAARKKKMGLPLASGKRWIIRWSSAAAKQISLLFCASSVRQWNAYREIFGAETDTEIVVPEPYSCTASILA